MLLRQHIKATSAKNIPFVFLSLIVVFLLLNTGVRAQRSDHLTSEEVELIRFNQEIDKRIGVYVRAVERRFLILKGNSELTRKELKQLKKETEKWGELTKTSRTQALGDIDKIIDEAISKIEDVADRDMKSKLLAKAIHILADSSRDFISRLSALADKTKNSRERAIISSAIENCNLIIEASGKLKRPEKEKKKRH